MRLSMSLRLASLLAFTAALLPAQIGTSTITGSVVDPSGSPVPEVVVTVTNVDTNFKFMARTNTEGLYRVPSLQPGPYRITFQSTGFKQFVRDGVMLRTGDVLPVDATLAIGAVTESIAVAGTAALLETQTSSSGSVVEGHTLSELPMYQRFVDATVHVHSRCFRRDHIRQRHRKWLQHGWPAEYRNRHVRGRHLGEQPVGRRE